MSGRKAKLRTEKEGSDEAGGCENTEFIIQGANQQTNGSENKLRFVAIVETSTRPILDHIPLRVSRTTSGDDEELSHLARHAITNPVGASASPVRVMSALKGGSPGRHGSPLRVQFAGSTKSGSKSSLEGIPEGSSGDMSPVLGNAVRPKARTSAITSSFRLQCAACKTLLGKFGLMVLFLGCIGLAIATYGTALFYSSTVMVASGAAAFGISLFRTCRSQTPAPAPVVHSLVPCL